MSAPSLTVTDDGTLLSDGVECIYLFVTDGLYNGIDLFGRESERRLLPLVGPTVWCLARHLVDLGGYRGEMVPLHRVARALGVPVGKVRQSIKRGARFGVFEHSSGAVSVARRWSDPKGKIR